jgi:hypothetical protein
VGSAHGYSYLCPSGKTPSLTKNLKLMTLPLLVADAAQEYSAIVMGSEILKSGLPGPSFSTLSFDNAFIKEQKQLADLGLDDYSRNPVNE